jgi:hypothetical protein
VRPVYSLNPALRVLCDGWAGEGKSLDKPLTARRWQTNKRSCMDVAEPQTSCSGRQICEGLQNHDRYSRADLVFGYLAWFYNVRCKYCLPIFLISVEIYLANYCGYLKFSAYFNSSINFLSEFALALRPRNSIKLCRPLLNLLRVIS